MYPPSLVCWVLKLDPNGSVAWQKTYGESDWFDEANSIQQTSDGGYIVAGQTWSPLNPPGLAVMWDDFWVLKLNSDGSVAWQMTYGGDYIEGDGIDVAHSIHETSDGGYIVAGGAGSFGAG